MYTLLTETFGIKCLEALKDFKQVSDLIINTFWNNHSKNDVGDRLKGDGAGGPTHNCNGLGKIENRKHYSGDTKWRKGKACVTRQNTLVLWLRQLCRWWYCL